MSHAAVFRSAEVDRRPRRDLRLVPVLLAAYAAAWLGNGFTKSDALVFWAACALVGVTLVVSARNRRPRELPSATGLTSRARTRRRTAAAMLLIASGVGSAATARAIATHSGPLQRLAAAHSKATVEAVLSDDPHTVTTRHGPLAIVPARAERVTTDDAQYRIRLPITVLASAADAWQPLLPSTRVSIVGRLHPAGDDHAEAAVLSARRPPEIVTGPTAIQRFAGGLRQGLRDACAGLPSDPRGLIPGLVIGDVSEESAGLAEAFRDTGLTHLTAVSGENLVFVLGAAMPVARFAGVRGRVLTVAGLAVVVGFTVLARPEPSMVRASAMSVLGLLLAASGRRSRGIPLLCAGAILLLLFDPWLASSYGFALSLSATAGLFVLAPGLQERLSRRGVPHRVAESLACTAAAETFCLPILVSLTAAITPLSLPANLLAEFCVGPATVLGAAALVAAAVWLPLGRAVAWLAQWPTDGIVYVARFGARLPGATIPWPDGTAGSVALLGVYAAAVIGMALVAVRREAR